MSKAESSVDGDGQRGGEDALSEPPLPLLEQPTKRVATNVLFKSAFQQRWDDWRWQLRHRIRTFKQLEELFPSLSDQSEIAGVITKYPMSITPYYASLIRSPDISDPIYGMSVPQVCELRDSPFLSDDPLEEDHDMPVPGLIHRYPDRALVMATTTCGSYCRHCTRKRVAGIRECSISARRLQQVTEYLTAHPEIKDVVISGGDPFTMATEHLELVLAAIRTVKSVDIVRLGTRTPVVLPMRITDELVHMLRRYHPVWVNTHFNHPNELTAEAAEACARLVDAGIPVGNQTVLLRGINDSPQIIEELCRGLVKMRVRPYYLFQCDLVRGVEHFRTPLSLGIEIMEYLRGRLSGLAIPAFVVDAPHGGGKIPVLPNYIVSTAPGRTVLRNYEGVIVSYPDPVETGKCSREPKDCSNINGVWELTSGKLPAIIPAGSVRYSRRAKIQTPSTARNSF